MPRGILPDGLVVRAFIPFTVQGKDGDRLVASHELLVTGIRLRALVVCVNLGGSTVKN